MSLFMWVSILGSIAGIAAIVFYLFLPWGPIGRDKALILGSIVFVLSLAAAAVIKTQQRREPNIPVMLIGVTDKLDQILAMLAGGASHDQLLAQLGSVQASLGPLRHEIINKGDEQNKRELLALDRKIDQISALLARRVQPTVPSPPTLRANIAETLPVPLIRVQGGKEIQHEKHEDRFAGPVRHRWH
jgi:hypothetical protein